MVSSFVPVVSVKKIKVVFSLGRAEKSVPVKTSKKRSKVHEKGPRLNPTILVFTVSHLGESEFSS